MADGGPLRWQVRETETRPLAGSTAPPTDESGGDGATSGGGRGRWWVVLLSSVVLIGLGAVMVRANLDARRERERLLLDLTATVMAEAKAQVLEDGDAAQAFLDPEASRDWAARYVRLYNPAPVNPYNELCGVYGPEWQPSDGKVDVVLEAAAAGPGGRRVVVRVAWRDGSRATERRAYREVDGSWRRAPLTVAERVRGADREVQLGDVLLRGPAADVADLTQDPELALDFAALGARVLADLPFVSRAARGGPRVTVVVRPTELEGPVIEVGVAPERLVVVNSPALALVNPDGPVSAAALYRLALARGVLAAQFHQFGVQELPFAPNWSLTEAEQRAVRNRLREALAGEWRSQLSRADEPAEAFRLRYREYDEWQRRCISDALLVQQLVVTGRVASYGELVDRFGNTDAEAAELLLLVLSKQSTPTLYEAWAQAWATTPEP